MKSYGKKVPVITRTIFSLSHFLALFFIWGNLSICGNAFADDFQDGLAQFEEGHYHEAFKLIKKVAETGNANAEYKLAESEVDNYRWVRGLFRELQRFESLKEDWPIWLTEVEDWLYADGQKHYVQTEREFLEWMRQDGTDWQIPFEHLAVYFLFTYFCGAVYDGEILASAQLGVAHIWMIREMMMAAWLRNGKELNLEDMRELVLRYSRELEHSDINQKQMEKLMCTKRLPWLIRKGKR